MAEKDITEKLLEEYNDVFADIINVLVFKGKQIVKEKDLEDDHPATGYKANGTMHQQERDISKFWKHASFRLACFGLENMTEYERVFPLRGFGYDGASYRAQALEVKKGQTFYPVFTLVLYYGNTHWKKNLNLKDVVTFPPEMKNDLLPLFNNYHVNLFEIAFLTDEQISMFKSDFKLVAEYFVKSRKNPNYVPSPDQIKHVDAILKLFSAMTGDDRFEQVLTLPDERRVKTMSNVLEFREAKGEARGKIIGTVNTLRKLGKTDKEIISFIREEYNLKLKDAKAYVTPPEVDNSKSA